MAGSITVTASGFAALPATAPANWPAGVTWPGGQLPNGSRAALNVPDADMIALITWAAATQIAQGTPAAPTTVTAGQILVAFVLNWFSGLKNAVAQYFTTLPVVPPPINLN